MTLQDGFVSKLDEKWKQKARDELNEDERETIGAVDTLRSWALQQHWLKTPTDTGFLLRFLRVRKFSQLAARETLVNYWTARTKYPEWFNSRVSPSDPAILDVVKSGFYVYTPGEDSHGRRLVIERPGVLRVWEMMDKHGVDIVFQTIMCIIDVLTMDERMQVNGFVMLHDGSMSKTDDTDLVYNITNMRKSMPIYQKAYPNRIKSLHAYRLFAVYEILLKVVKSLLSDKISKRLHVHSKSLVSVYKHIDKSVLPREYLPDDYEGPCAGTMQDVIDNMVSEFTDPKVVAHINMLNSGNYGVDMSLKAKTEVPAESFRKLNI